MKLITFILKDRFLLALSVSYSRPEGGLEENSGMWRTSGALQKDILTNLIPSDIFLVKWKEHGFPFILLIILLLLALYYKIYFWSSAFAYVWGLNAFNEIGSYYQWCAFFFFFTENPFKKHLLTAFSVLDFRYTKMNKVQYLSSKIHSLVRTGYIKY